MNWFECKVAYHKLVENGLQKKVTDTFMVDALSFTEAEARVIEEVTPYVSGEMDVTSVKKTKIAEIFRDDSADKWYLVKVAFKEPQQKSYYWHSAVSASSSR